MSQRVPLLSDEPRPAVLPVVEHRYQGRRGRDRITVHGANGRSLHARHPGTPVVVDRGADLVRLIEQRERPVRIGARKRSAEGAARQ